MSALIVNLYKPTFSDAPESANDIIVRGVNCFFARRTGMGSLPPGINWVGMEKGVRFWGTPLRAGTWEAEFEGPYPANFFSELTYGGSDEPPIQMDVGNFSENIIVDKFSIKFIVIDQSGYTFGQVLKELASNPSVAQTARRVSWVGSRCIGMVGLNESITESDIKLTDIKSAESLGSVASNLASLINSSGVATASAQGLGSGIGVTVTGLENGPLSISVSSTVQGAISSTNTKQGTSTEKQITSISLLGVFKGGVNYSVTIGSQVYSVLTQADPKAGIYLYQDQIGASRLEGRPLRNYDISPEDYLAGDWFFGLTPVIDRSFNGCLLTTGFVGNLPSVDSRIVVSAAIPV